MPHLTSTVVKKDQCSSKYILLAICESFGSSSFSFSSSAQSLLKTESRISWSVIACLSLVRISKFLSAQLSTTRFSSIKPRDLRSLTSCNLCFRQDTCLSKTILYNVWRYSVSWPDQHAHDFKDVDIWNFFTSIDVFNLASHNIRAIASFQYPDDFLDNWLFLGGCAVWLNTNSIALRLSTLGLARELSMIRATFLPSAWNFMSCFRT